MKRIFAIFSLFLTFATLAEEESYIDPEKDHAEVKTIEVIDVPIIDIVIADLQVYSVETIDFQQKQINLLIDAIKQLECTDLSLLSFSQLQTLSIQLNQLSAYSFYGLSTTEITTLKQQIRALTFEIETAKVNKIAISEQSVSNAVASIEYVTADKNEQWKKGKFLIASLEQQTKWLKVLNENQNYEMDYIKEAKNPRILSHAYAYESVNFDMDVIESNLLFAISKGYDSIHVLFDCNESIYATKAIISNAKSLGLGIYISFTSLEDKYNWNVYDIDPSQIEDRIAEYAPLADGMILGWKKMSMHSTPMPKEFWNFICKTARKSNDRLKIYGEAYYGPITQLTGSSKMVLGLNMPKNATGVIVNNFGYSDYNHTYLINRLLPTKISNFSSLKAIFQIVGQTDYYASKNDMNLRVFKEYQIKRKIEDRCHSLDCGTVTLVHDGIEELHEKQYNTFNNIVYQMIDK